MVQKLGVNLYFFVVRIGRFDYNEDIWKTWDRFSGNVNHKLYNVLKEEEI